MSEVLVDALRAARSRLEAGVAEAERELARARLRSRELRRSIAVPDLPEPAAARQPPARDVPVAAQAAKALPRAWRGSLARLRRGNPSGAADLFSRNVIVRWEGNGPLAGTYLGGDAAAAFVARLAERVGTRATRLEHIVRQDDNLEIVATLAFVGASGGAVPARVTSVFRLDEDGRVALWFASPEDPAAIDAVLRDAASRS